MKVHCAAVTVAVPVCSFELRPIHQFDRLPDDSREAAAVARADSFAAARGHFVFHLAEDHFLLGRRFHVQAVARVGE